jgi:hypothetical protein
MATRLLICVVLAVLAGAALVIVTIQSSEVKVSEVMAGFAIEAIGILVTVGFVDLLLERDRMRERAKVLAWNMITTVDHAVWVWQGGSRRLDLGELVGLITLIDDRDPRPSVTENLLLRIGDVCQSIVQMRDPAVTMNKDYLAGFEALAKLSYFRDSPISSPANHELQSHLRSGVESLLIGLELAKGPASMPEARDLENKRDPSEAGQNYRSVSDRAILPAA